MKIKVNELNISSVNTGSASIPVVIYNTQGENITKFLYQVDSNLDTAVKNRLYNSYRNWTVDVPEWIIDGQSTITLAFNAWLQQWINAHNREISRIASALYSDFSPLENFDRVESYSDTETHSGAITATKEYQGIENNNRTYQDQPNSKDEFSKSGEFSEALLHGKTETDIHTNTSTLTFTNRTKTHLESAFNDTGDSFRNKDRDVDSGTETTTEQTPILGNTLTNSGKDTTTTTFDNYKETTEHKQSYTDNTTTSFTNRKDIETTDLSDDEHKNVHEGSLHGNIGVTQSVDMIRNEIDLRLSNNLGAIIIDNFMNESGLLEWDPSEIF